MNSRSTGIAIALGGGAARGLAHIGILKVLHHYHIPVTAIAGTSMGAIIGGMYAAGLDPEFLEEIALSIDWKKIFRILMPSGLQMTGLVDGENLQQFLEEHLPVNDFGKVRIPFYCVATDLLSGEEVIFRSGKLSEAIRASASFPFLFKPFIFNDQLLADGGLVNPLPLSVLAREGYIPTIAADVSLAPGYRFQKIRSRLKKASGVEFFNRALKIQSLYIYPLLIGRFFRLKKKEEIDLRLWEQLPHLGNIMEHQLVCLSLQLYSPRIILKPAIQAVKFFDFLKAKEIIQQGERTALEELSSLEAILQDK